MADSIGPEHPTTCRSCKAAIYFVLTAKGKRLPMDVAPGPDGKPITHFATCPQSKRWSKGRKRGKSAFESNLEANDASGMPEGAAWALAEEQAGLEAGEGIDHLDLGDGGD